MSTPYNTGLLGLLYVKSFAKYQSANKYEFYVEL